MGKDCPSVIECGIPWIHYSGSLEGQISQNTSKQFLGRVMDPKREGRWIRELLQYDDRLGKLTQRGEIFRDTHGFECLSVSQRCGS